MNYQHQQMQKLEALYLETRSAAADYKLEIEATAKALDRDPKALRRYVQARAKDKLHELRAELASLEQLDLDFGGVAQAAENLNQMLARDHANAKLIDDAGRVLAEFPGAGKREKEGLA